MTKSVATTLNVLSFLLGLFLQAVRNKKGELQNRQDVNLALDVDQVAEMVQTGGSVEFKDMKVNGDIRVTIVRGNT